MSESEEARQNIKAVLGVDNPTPDLVNFFVVLDQVRGKIIKRKLAELEAQRNKAG